MTAAFPGMAVVLLLLLGFCLCLSQQQAWLAGEQARQFAALTRDWDFGVETGRDDGL